MSDNNLLDNLIEQYEAQCEALERMYNEDINALISECDHWKQRALDAEAQIENTAEKTENVKNRMRHV